MMTKKITILKKVEIEQIKKILKMIEDLNHENKMLKEAFLKASKI
jgi:hypothetical protein